MRATAKDWIASKLEAIAIDLSVQIKSWHWETIAATNAEAAYYRLIVTGRDNRRMVKLFSADELDRCIGDKQLQNDIQIRLTRLLLFTSGNLDRRQKRRR